MTIRCGNPNHDLTLTKVHHHNTVAQVRLCYARGVESIEEAEAVCYDDLLFQEAADAELAYEHYLETRYQDEFAWEEDQERMRIG